MWELQKGKEELPLLWFYYYYRLNIKPNQVAVSEEVFNRTFPVYCKNLKYAIIDTKIDLYTVLVHTLYEFFNKKFQ